MRRSSSSSPPPPLFFNSLSLFFLFLLVLPHTILAHTHHQPAVLPLIDGEFVSVHVGYPGQDVAFHLRWDLDYIGVFAPLDLSAVSRTYSPPYQTDAVCFAARCIRLPLRLLGGEPPPTDAGALYVQLPLRGHGGVLGLAPGSPLRQYYPWLMLNADTLHLLAHLPRPTSSLLLPVTHTPDTAFAARVGTQQFLVQARVWQELTYAPVDLALQRKWRLDMYSYRQGRFSRRLKLQLDEDSLHIHDGLSSPVSFVVPQRAALFVGSSGTDSLWNASAGNGIILGRFAVQRFFTATISPNGSVVWLDAITAHRPLTRESDLAPYLLLFLLFIVLWTLGVYESSLRAERISHLAGQRPRMLDSPRRAFSFISCKHPGFVAFASLATFVALSAFTLTLTMGFGYSFAFKGRDIDALDLAAAYSTLAMAWLLAAIAFASQTHPTLTPLAVAAGLFYAVWAMVFVSPFGVVRMLILLLSSAVPTIFLLYLWMRVVFGNMWPHSVYNGNAAKRIFWSVLLTIAAAWAVWQLAFYTVPFMLLTWRPATTLRYAVGLICAAVCALIASDLYMSHGQVNMLYQYKRLRLAVLQRRTAEGRGE